MISMRMVALYVLSLPLLAFFIVFDLVKLPFLIIFFWPLFAFLDLLFVLRGERSMIGGFIVQSSVLGILMWMHVVGIEEPRWLG
jgi:hypothetical protein